MFGRIIEKVNFDDKTRRLRTLSDSDSSKSEPKWLCKPRLNGVKSTNKSHQVRRKRAFIPSSSSEEDIDDSSSRQDEKPVVTLKQMVKKTKKSRAKKGTNSSDESDAIDSEENAHFDSDTDSDDSRAGEHRSKKRIGAMAELYTRCVEFFNTANRDKLMSAPRMTPKVADYILENRPFASFEALVCGLLI
ncbi:unnamed protein product [Anisakis simplex]|uniref:Rad21_Rec8 domain-containing protein n=1 Tax=Anisakis simplex TaxID=6269 RepID=A0A0M3J4A4_ANISI|nr:unnamed protein product [Anisakis simplex]